MAISNSIKQIMNRLDRDEERFQQVLDCYLAAILAIRENVTETTPEETTRHREKLKELYVELSSAHEPETLANSRNTLLRVLQSHHDSAVRHQAQRDEDWRAVAVALGEAAATLEERNDRQSVRLREVTQQLQHVSRVTDLADIRRKVAKQVLEIHRIREEMWRENNASIHQMQAQLVEVQERLKKAETRAASDALTGLMNRGEGERLLAARLESGEVLSVILIDLDDFKQVNDRWGHNAGDQVLKTVGHVLAHNVRLCDAVCRWGGDEFMIILNTELQTARKRAEALRKALCIRHQLVILGNITEVWTSASFGVAQNDGNDDVEALVGRADLNLYENKLRRQPGHGAAASGQKCSGLLTTPS
jgi:diguanylate cyclase (GGDEF)-like protein